MNKLVFFALAGALAAGALTAYVDFHATEETATLLVILLSNFTLGVLYGRLGWLWALIVAGSLTGAHVVAPHFGILPRDGEHIGHPLSLMILTLPAAISAYCGAGLRQISNHRRV